VPGDGASQAQDAALARGLPYCPLALQGSTAQMNGEKHLPILRDAFHLVWWMTNIMHFSFVLVLLAFAKISAVVQLCSLGSPELSLKTLMAYPDLKTVASFVYSCLREAVPPQSRV
jgi:hypothetical protein